jgi:hypothetical protein
MSERSIRPVTFEELGAARGHSRSCPVCYGRGYIQFADKSRAPCKKAKRAFLRENKGKATYVNGALVWLGDTTVSLPPPPKSPAQTPPPEPLPAP